MHKLTSLFARCLGHVIFPTKWAIHMCLNRTVAVSLWLAPCRKGWNWNFIFNLIFGWTLLFICFWFCFFTNDDVNAANFLALVYLNVSRPQVGLGQSISFELFAMKDLMDSNKYSTNVAQVLTLERLQLIDNVAWQLMELYHRKNYVGCSIMHLACYHTWENWRESEIVHLFNLWYSQEVNSIKHVVPILCTNETVCKNYS